jgi:hypothetical protein
MACGTTPGKAAAVAENLLVVPVRHVGQVGPVRLVGLPIWEHWRVAHRVVGYGGASTSSVTLRPAFKFDAAVNAPGAAPAKPP